MKSRFKVQVVVFISLLVLLSLIGTHSNHRPVGYHDTENVSGRLAPLITAHKPASKYGTNVAMLSNRYIVHLKRSNERISGPMGNPRSLSEQPILHALEAHKQMLIKSLSMPSSNSTLDHIFDFEDFVGYSGEFDDTLLENIRRDPAVELVEQDQVVWANCRKDLVIPGEVDSFSFDSYIHTFKRKTLKNREIELVLTGSFISGYDCEHRGPRSQGVSEQRNAPWGLSKVSSQATFVGEGNMSYLYPRSAGSDVNIYIVDSGINIDHSDFEGRAIWGATIPQFDLDTDGNGHGTHVAGIAGGRTFGIAKNSTIIAVKVLRTDGLGSNADVIKGIEWVMNHHSSAGKRSVVNMSLGGGRSLALEKAIESCINAGIHFSVAAGNDNANACNFSPASSAHVITVGASTSRDQLAYFSNTGPCVDIFAPGMDITSSWIGSATATNTVSGTSMASPHVAGVLALYLAERDYPPDELKSIILKTAISGVLDGIPPQTTNRLISTKSLLCSISEPESMHLHLWRKSSHSPAEQRESKGWSPRRHLRIRHLDFIRIAPREF